MNTIAQISAIGLTFVLTYLFFRSLGPRSSRLFLSRAEKAEWWARLTDSLGGWIVITNIFGTLTSFATVLFLVSSVKLFGWYAAATGITIAIGAFVTIKLTLPVVRHLPVARLLWRHDQVASVIASLFWNDSSNAKKVSRIIKWTSLAVILSIIWLECTAFVDLTFWLNGQPKPLTYSALLARFCALFAVSFIITFFVLRYGIRGFVFADLLHAPLIGFTALVLLLGALWLTRELWFTVPLVEITRPLLSDHLGPIDYVSPLIFALHVLVLNTAQVVCSENHWFRMWFLGRKELERQWHGAGITGLVWLAMLPIGFSAFYLTASPGTPGEPAVAALLDQLSAHWVVLVMVFWLGATAALFSTADVQIYSALLVSRFSPTTGELRPLELTARGALGWSLGSSLLFALAYAAARGAGLPLEKIIFVVVPFCTVLFPAFLHFALGGEVRAWVLGVSILGYVGVAGYGFVAPEHNFVATLSAVFIPPTVAILTLWKMPKRSKRGSHSSDEYQ